MAPAPMVATTHTGDDGCRCSFRKSRSMGAAMKNLKLKT
jgi:hypothetical protein